ncbi:MAG: hypothetical protein QM731_19545 [Chitinophagaceae bacterium]
MLLQRLVLTFFLSSTLYLSRAQTYFALSSLPQLAVTIADSIGKADMYFVAQAHRNAANVPIEKELLLALHKSRGVCYDILEFPQSAATILNEYLRTGYDSLLKAIEPQASFTFIKAVRQYNDNLPIHQQIRFYGIDFEGGARARFIPRAMEIIMRGTGIAHTESLFKLLDACKTDTPLLEKNQRALQQYLQQNETKARQLLGIYYTDVLLIANARFNFSPRRDGGMYENFKRLYAELARVNGAPKFFASFGYGHLNPKNTSGIAQRLHHTDDSPVKEKVVIVGVEYINCSFYGEKDQGSGKGHLGNLATICPGKVVKKVENTTTKEPAITFLSGKTLANLSCNATAGKLAGVLVLHNFDATRFWTWE